MEHGGDERPGSDQELDEYSEIEPTSDAVEDVQPERRAPRFAASDAEQSQPPDANDELGQYEGTYDAIGHVRSEEDLDLVSDELDDQGVDQAWPREEGLDEDDARASFDDSDAPETRIREDEDLGDAA